MKRLDKIVKLAKGLQKDTGVKLLWGTSNLFSHRRFMSGASTNPSPQVFAYAASQVKKAMEVTKELGGQGYVFWGGREGYETLLNTDMKREFDHLGAFLQMAVEYKKKMAETHNLTQKILHVKETGGEPASGQTDERELTKNIIIYLRQIANGELDQAHDTAEKIVRFHTQAVKILDRIAISEIPEPELADIERPVLAGFIKNLRARLT